MVDDLGKVNWVLEPVVKKTNEYKPNDLIKNFKDSNKITESNNYDPIYDIATDQNYYIINHKYGRLICVFNKLVKVFFFKYKRYNWKIDYVYTIDVKNANDSEIKDCEWRFEKQPLNEDRISSYRIVSVKTNQTLYAETVESILRKKLMLWSNEKSASSNLEELNWLVDC
jgi:hypothetical protein